VTVTIYDLLDMFRRAQPLPLCKCGACGSTFPTGYWHSCRDPAFSELLGLARAVVSSAPCRVHRCVNRDGRLERLKEWVADYDARGKEKR
jgi:hypothetical protein